MSPSKAKDRFIKEIMRKIGVLFIFLVASGHLWAQQDADRTKKMQMDSVKEARTDQAALMYARLRQFSITHQENMTGNISAKLYGRDFFKGRFRSSRTTINLNVPIVERSKDLLVGSIGVVHQFFYLSELEPYDPQYPVSRTDTYIPMVSLGMSYTHRDSIFGKPFSITASVNGLFDPPMERRQITFTGVVAFPIIHKENTNLVAGMVFSVDPSSPAPVIPFVSYYHRFKSMNTELMIDLPYRFAVRKPMKRASLTAFSEMSGSNSFFEFQDANPTLPAKMTYSLLELKSGMLFEYRVTRKLVFSLSGGITSTLKSRILEQGAGPNDYFIKNTNQTVPYAQVGLSLLPFWKPFSRSTR